VGGSYTQMTKKESKYPMPIREWSEDDRPREKLLNYGEHIEYGTVDQANPYIRDIIQMAIRYNAPSIIVAHNHPSGSVTPSNADKRFTKSLMMATKATGMGFFDHIIIGDNGYFSFADEGLIEEYDMRAIREL